MTDQDMIDQMAEAERKHPTAKPCQACSALDQMSEEAKITTIRALSGSIGEKTLAKILTSNGYPTGARAISRHRSEGHTP